jgi:hypothetical protein
MGYHPDVNHQARQYRIVFAKYCMVFVAVLFYIMEKRRVGEVLCLRSVVMLLQ